MTKKEIKDLNGFVSRYREIQLSLDLMQKSIISLAKKRDDLIRFLNVEDFNSGISSIAIPSDLSFNFTMPTDQKSYDVVNTPISMYIETDPGYVMPAGV